MVYGPYDTSLPATRLEARFELQVFSRGLFYLSQAVRIDIHDATSGQIIATREIPINDFPANGVYYRFPLSFDLSGRSNHAIETRVWSYGYHGIKARTIEIFKP
jgi:hypothetical protein